MPPSSRVSFGGEQSRLVLCGERLDDLAERFALHDLRQLVERQVDAVIGHATLREIIGANALGAIARADLLLALRRARGIEPLLFSIIDARAQDVHGAGAVLMLRAGVLHE